MNRRFDRSTFVAYTQPDSMTPRPASITVAMLGAFLLPSCLHLMSFIDSHREGERQKASLSKHLKPMEYFNQTAPVMDAPVTNGAMCSD